MFTERVKQAMRVEGLTPVTLAQKTGIHVTNIRHLLRGARGPSLRTLHKLLSALPKVDARWLITGEES
jgi:transcriptional regulator with XRE-family HTH domain